MHVKNLRGGTSFSEPSPERLKEAMAKLTDYGIWLGEKAKAISEAFEEIQKNFAEPFSKIVARLAQLPGNIEKIQEGLAEKGWFVLAEMPLDEYFKLGKMLDEGKSDEIDELMVQWTYHLMDETLDKLCVDFPDREPLIQEGFQNHRDGRYASAITLLLTQADGICSDSLGQVFFLNKDKLPKIKWIIDDLGVQVLAKITLLPVLIKSGINANDSEVAAGQYPDSPHRHGILHGTIKDYATELNSLKIISFVGFMGVMVHSIVVEAKAATAAAP